jgi:hypothetical protein
MHRSESGRVPGIIIFLVFVAVIGGGIMAAQKLFRTFQGDWKTVDRIREGDAATVKAERDAGQSYIGKLKLDLTATSAGSGDKGVKAGLTGTISNIGNKDVLKAVAEVTFLPRDAASKPDVRNVILFDGSELSVTTDRPLSGGEERRISTSVDDLSPTWDTGKIYCKVIEARIDVGRE